MNIAKSARVQTGAFVQALLVAGLLTEPVLAQQDGAPNDPALAETIVVTAQFREQSVLEVPLAVTAYSGDFLDDTGIQSFADLSAFVPGFQVQEQSPNNPGFVLRGITSDDGAATIEPRVSVFQNGVSVSRSRGSVVPLYDLERVEVLNGPQGTLFGRSAQIGAVHIITNRAGPALSAALNLQGGNLGQMRATGHINIPLIAERLAVRIAGFYDKRDGFITNTTGGDLNSVDTRAVRGSLNWSASDDLSVDLIANYVRNTPAGTAFKSGVIPALGGTTDPNDFASLNTFGGLLDGRPLGLDRDVFDVTLIGNWAISDAWSVTSTTAYREFDSREVFDPDGTALSLLIFAEDATGEQLSSDIRFAFDDVGRLSGFFGGGVFHEKGSQAVPLGFDLSGLQLFTTFGATPDPLTPGADVPLPASVDRTVLGALLTGNPAIFAPTGLTQVESFTNSADNTSIDVFGELTYALTDKIDFTAGLRYTRDDKESRFAAAVTELNPTILAILGAGVPLPVVSVIGGVSDGTLSSKDQAGLKDSFDGLSWRAVVNYEFQPGRYAYFNYSRGRRPQVIDDGFDRDAVDANGNGVIGDVVGSFEVVPAETVDSFEVGLKGRFIDQRLTLQTAVYYYKYKNFQTSIDVTQPGSAPQFDLINAGTAQSYGFEAQGYFTASDNLDVFATYGYNHSRFDDTDGDGNRQQFAGNRFRLSPDHALSVGFDAHVALSNDVTAFLRPTFTWQSKVFFTNDNDPAFDVVDPVTGATIFTVPAISQGSNGLLNLTAGMELAGGRAGFELFATNLLDEKYIIDGGNTGGSFQIPTFIAGAPQIYGLRLTFRL